MYEGLLGLQREGMPVECIRPQGAIYLSARFALHGLRTPNGETIRTDEDVRRYLLHAAGMAVVPFGAFGSVGENGWFRLSIGVVSVAQLEALIPRIRTAVGTLAGLEVAP
jgi:aspartate aminotransferase